MAIRPFSREQAWMLPPTLDELIPQDHPARYVAAFVECVGRDEWMAMGMDLEGKGVGAPPYHPLAMVSAWIYGFMTGVRSNRKLERACREQLPFLWVTGWQRPDHNSLWRFYRDHREGMRRLLKHTVRTAVEAQLVDLALQAVDGTKVVANAAKERTLDGAGLQRLLERTEQAIKDLEAQNEQGEEMPTARLPEELQQAQALRERVQAALGVVAEGPLQVNLTDGDARLMKSRQGIVAGYNAQAMVSPLRGAEGQQGSLLITAVAVVTDPDDHAQLAPMVAAARQTVGQVETTLADAGYHSGANVAACAALEQQVVMPEAQEQALQLPYHKDRFLYDAATDSYTCPMGQRLRRIGQKHRTRQAEPVRTYRASRAVCRACPAFGTCTRDRRQGRSLEIGPWDAALRQHRAWMKTEKAQALYTWRKELAEPVFGIIKECLGGRRFLLRGLANVGAEWSLLATAFNLQALWRMGVGWGDRAMPRPLGCTASFSRRTAATYAAPACRERSQRRSFLAWADISTRRHAGHSPSPGRNIPPSIAHAIPL